MNENIFCISALAYKKRSNQKSSIRVKKNPPISGIKCPYFFVLPNLIKGHKTRTWWQVGLAQVSAPHTFQKSIKMIGQNNYINAIY